MVPLAAAWEKHRAAGPRNWCLEGWGVARQAQREARDRDSPLIRGGNEEGIRTRVAVVADLHDELRDAHADVVQQPQQRVVIRRVCEGAQGLMTLATEGPRPPTDKLPLRGAQFREASSGHWAGGHRYLGRSSARRSSPWAQSSSTLCGTPGTDQLAGAAFQKVYLEGRWATQGQATPGQREPDLQPLSLLTPPPGLLGTQTGIQGPASSSLGLFPFLYVLAPEGPASAMPFPQALPYKSYSFLRPSSASKTTIDEVLTRRTEHFTTVCQRVLTAGCGSYPHFTGGETEAQSF